jgi:hypothetical protein
MDREDRRPPPPNFLTGLLAARLMMGESRYMDPLIWGVKGG